ncbi:sigma-70 family RNA polymerase sigma factor [Streptosporangiaceae bacterium NEAU-GS5]|nr:sigma-70 family RNA polymerase sigma factor [Streptosporangiaceae bacterium NEAU-GS5]
MADDHSVADLVERARKGDQDAWRRLLKRYTPFVGAICHHYRLSREDGLDVGQVVWLRVWEKFDSLQQPEAFTGWLATITRRECLHTAQAARRREGKEHVLDFDREAGDESVAIGQELERAERQAALRAAFAELPEHCRSLLLMLMEDTSLSYAEIAARLCVPIGRIGPTRGRCLAKLRRSPHLKGFLGPSADDETGSGDGSPLG